MKKHIDKIIIGYLFILFAVFFISNITFDLGDVGLACFSNSMVLTKASDSNQSFEQAVKDFAPGYQRSYKQNTFNYPLSAVLLFAGNKLFGVSSGWAVYVCILSALGAILLSFYLGKLLYDRFFGVVFATLIAMDVYFNVNIKTGAVIFAINVFLILGTIYFFLKAHHQEQKKKLKPIIFSGIFASMCLFNGYPQPYCTFLFLAAFMGFIVLLAIISKFKLIDGSYRKFKLIKFYYYIIFVVVSLSCLIYAFMWDGVCKAEFGTTYKETLVQNLGRFSPQYSPLKMDKEEFKTRVVKFLDTVFVDSDRDAYFSMSGVHSDTAFARYPVIAYVSGIFFFIGLFYLFKRRKESDILLIVFLAVTSFVIIGIFRPFAPRAYIFTTPFLLIISSLGYIKVFNGIISKIPKISCVYRKGLILLIVIVLTSPQYDAITNEFVKRRVGQKIWNAGQNEIFDFLKKNINDRSLVVLAGSKDVYAWLHYIYFENKEIPTVFYYDESLINKNFELWKNRKYKDFDTIYFVFPSEYYAIENPGGVFGNYGMKIRFTPFLNANPNIQPAKVVSSKLGVPMHYIYRINKNDQYRKRTIVLRMKDKKPVDVKINQPLLVDSLYVKGEADSIVFSNGYTKQKIDLNLKDNMDAFIDFGENSVIEFYPDFDQDEPFDNVAVYEGLSKGKGGFRVSLKKGYNKGKLVFKFDFPYNIKSAHIRTNPRIFNDYMFLNRISSYYSSDGENYKQLYNIVSNGNVRFGRYHLPGRGGNRDRRPNWSGFNEYSSYDVVYPNSKTLYYKAVFHGVASDSEVQLLSFSKSMFFKLFIDTSKVNAPIIGNDTTLMVNSKSGKDVLVYLTIKRRN